MNLVIDASVVVALLVDSGADGTWAEALFHDTELYAPQLIQVETASVLRRLLLANKISKADASAAYDDLLQLPIELLPFEPFAERIWALKDNVSSYDAWYIAIAESLAASLATLDKRLVNAPGVRCEFVSPL